MALIRVLIWDASPLWLIRNLDVRTGIPGSPGSTRGPESCRYGAYLHICPSVCLSIYLFIYTCMYRLVRSNPFGPHQPTNVGHVPYVESVPTRYADHKAIKPLKGHLDLKSHVDLEDGNGTQTGSWKGVMWSMASIRPWAYEGLQTPCPSPLSQPDMFATACIQLFNSTYHDLSARWLSQCPSPGIPV